MMDLIGKFLVGVVLVSNVDQYELFDHYKKLGFSETQIIDDLIFTLQERMANMSDIQKKDYDINDDGEEFNNAQLNYGADVQSGQQKNVEGVGF